MKKISLLMPPLPEQKAIAHVLGKLDDKIALNRQINQTLETMAQTLFKSWFVNFDPVIDNALKAGNPIPDPLKTQAEKRKTTKSTLPKTTQNLFPNRFVFNDKLKKWIPEGWKLGIIGDRYFVKGGYAFKSEDFVKNGVPIVKIKNIKNNKKIDNNELQFVSKDVAKQKQNFYLKTGDILMAMTGATVGKFGVVIKDEDCIIDC
jgi:type I restriction enzyme S subunit